MHKRQTAQKGQQSDGVQVEAAGRSWSSERLFFPNQSWPGVSLHSSAALTAAACCSTHTMLLPSTLLCTLLIYSTVYHSNPLPLTGKRYVLGRPESIRGCFFFKGMLRKTWNKYYHADNNHHLSFKARNSKQMSFCIRLHNSNYSRLCGRGEPKQRFTLDGDENTAPL